MKDRYWTLTMSPNIMKVDAVIRQEKGDGLMHQWFKRLLLVFVAFSLIACNTSEEQPSTTENTNVPVENVQDGPVLVVYFSWADNAVLEDDVDAVSSPSVIAPGNVEQLATWVQEESGGDLFSIRVTDPYPSDWNDCLARANQERREQARPELVENVSDISQYDTIFLGYPNWWYGVPMTVLHFLEQNENDLAGKQVYLFCSHGTGGLANSVSLIEEAIPQASISDNIFDCYEEEASSSQEAIQNWVSELGYSQELE